MCILQEHVQFGEVFCVQTGGIDPQLLSPQYHYRHTRDSDFFSVTGFAELC
jgi:hypothetical protein